MSSKEERKARKAAEEAARKAARKAVEEKVAEALKEEAAEREKEIKLGGLAKIRERTKGTERGNGKPKEKG